MTAAPLALDVGASGRPAASPTRYRPDIDGLRAIAVVGVVLFHAFPGVLRGGFVGVDVFFVISGYLITSILRGQALAGTFSIGDFYERRIRRLFPALAVMLLAVTLVALVILCPKDLKSFGGSLGPSIAFMANFHFMKRGAYFAPIQDVRPLLHLWSLGVEEQFYLAWPWVVWALTRWRPRLLGPATLLIAAVSLVADQLTLGHDPLAAFYQTPLRIWEPLVGALLACGWIGPVRARALREALSLAGLAAILASMALLTEAAPFPGLAALPACLGAALVLQAGREAQDTVVARLLSTRPAVFLGAISYSLYLWHWPVMTFLRLGAPVEPPAWLMATGVALSLLLSVLSLKLIEARFRHPKRARLSRRQLFAAAFAGLAVVALTGSALTADGGLKARANAAARRAMAAEQDLAPIWFACHANSRPKPGDCDFGLKDKPTTDVLLVGDSLAGSWAPALQDWASEHRLKGRLITQGACLPALGVDVREKDGKLTPCRAHNADIVRQVRETPGLKAVVISARWMMYDKGDGPAEGRFYYLTRPDERGRDPKAYHALAQNGVDAFVSALIRNGPPGLKIVLIGPSPEFAYSPDRCLQRAAFIGRDPAPCQSEPAAPVIERQAGSVALLSAVARGRPQVSVLWPDRFFCGSARCAATVDGDFGFVDGDHLTQTAARRIGPRLLAGLPF